MKSLILPILLCIFSQFSCETDEGRLPAISLKTGANYIDRDTSLAAGSVLWIGISASKTESKDVLKKFNISKSINSGTNSSVFNKSLSGSEGDQFNYDYTDTLESTIGQNNKYIFTITNRDGLINQVSVNVVIK